MQVKIYIGESLLDTFPNENIELTSAVSSISDITKNLTDFTRSFTVPASDNNNKLFKHYYNANIDNTFDARTKVTGRIELDGMPFRYGKYRLEKVSVKQGKPYAYTIQFWGNTINLKDDLKNDELSVLDLSAYDHEYNSANVKTGLQTSLFGGDIVYTMFAKKQYYYNADGADDTLTPTLANIAYDNGGNAGVLWNDLKPSIKLLPIIEAIETKYNLTFSRDFFGREEFTNIYFWLNSNAEKSISGGNKIVEFNAGDSDFINFATNIGTYVVFRNPANFWNYKSFQLRPTITPDVGFENVEYKFKTYLRQYGAGVDTGFVLVRQEEKTGVNVMQNLFFDTIFNSYTFQVYYEIETIEAFSYDISLKQTETIQTSFSTGLSNIYTTTGNDLISGEVQIKNQLPKIKTIDFLKGLFQMFKLIVIAQDNGIIYVNSINDYYAEGKLINLTDYVDSDNYEVERGKLLNPIVFNFQEPQTLLNTQFEANTGQAYGDEELILEDSDGVQLDGESFEVKLPFEQIVYERLIDLNDGLQTNIMYAGVFDETIEGVNPKPHLHYVYNSNLDTKTISFINDVGSKEEVTIANIPTHSLGFDNPDFSLIWGNEFNEWDGNIITNTLYSNYYEDYITSVFNIKKRSFKFKGILPLRFQLTLGLNDVIQIRNNYYRIDNYTFNLLTKETSFNLVNSFDNTLNGFVANRTTITTDYTAKTESIFVTNGGNFSFNKVDVGFGIGWVTVSSIGSNVYFEFEENLTGVIRTMQVEIQNTLTLQEITITLIQLPTSVTADNGIITADTNLITADNG